MRRLTLFLLVSIAVGQTGQHRRIFTTSSSINCTTFPSTGIIESDTDGEIDFSTKPNVTIASIILTGDIIIAGASNNGGVAGVNPTLLGGGLTWNPLTIQPNMAVWYALVPSPAAGPTIVVTFSPQSSNRSLTVALIRQTGTFTTGGSSGVYSPGNFANFIVNSSTFTFNFSGFTGSNWIFGGVVFPSTGTYLHSLAIGVVNSYNGTSYTGGLYPPVGWHTIITSGLPSTSIVYSCSFP